MVALAPGAGELARGPNAREVSRAPNASETSLAPDARETSLVPNAGDTSLSPDGNEAAAGSRPVRLFPPGARRLWLEGDRLTGEGSAQILAGRLELSLPPDRPVRPVPDRRRWDPSGVDFASACKGEVVAPGRLFLDCRLRISAEYASSAGRISHVTAWIPISAAADVSGALPGDRAEFSPVHPRIGLSPGDCVETDREIACRRLGGYAVARVVVRALRRQSFPVWVEP